MIELIVYEYLNRELPVPVFMEKPDEEIEEYVLIEKTGSSEEDYIMNAMVIIQRYSNSLYGAASLNEKVKDKMRNIVSLKEISSVKINSDYNYTDTRTKKYRYQAVFDLFY